MFVDKIFSLFLLFAILFNSNVAEAVWFEATGQAVINKGGKEAARQQATQEAIKQALLFAGASVNSVQLIANGLLEDDRFEIRSSGEVNNIELIDEIYHDGYITVSIRADIFPQDAVCSASDYKKSIVTTWYNITKRQQAAVGSLYDFGKLIAEKLEQETQNHAQYSFINQVEPYYLSPTEDESKMLAFTLATKADAQFVLFGEIEEFGVEMRKPKKLAFWKKGMSSRNLTMSFRLYDGQSGDLVFQNQQAISSPWNFDPHTSMNSNSNVLWESPFGLATKKLIQDTVQKIDESVSCLSAYGRVLYVNNEQLNINIGKQNGVKQGDKLTLFQVNQFYDGNNQPHRQFQLHPEKVVVRQVFAETAVVESASGAPLANIQPNDFVARQ